MTPNDGLPKSRRTLLLAAGTALVGAWATTKLRSPRIAQANDEVQERQNPMSNASTRMPVTFLPHGGGPWPFVDMGLDPKEVNELAAYLRAVHDLPKTPPKAILAVSAHWESPLPTVMTAERPPMLYDYYGFPPESYSIQWSAPGSASVAKRVRDLLGAAGIESAEDSRRGFDHGTFVPLKLAYPQADVPTIQLSLQRGLDPARHLAIGRAIGPYATRASSSSEAE